MAAIFSSGFHHFDEHFQIIEFLNYKLGYSPVSDLPWEHKAMMRPWFQVYAYKVIYHIFHQLGLTSPFSFLFIFRLLGSMLGFYSLYRMIPVLKRWFRDEYLTIAFSILSLSWFVPYIHARTSSESFGISFLFLGISYFLKEKPCLKSSLLAGVFFGISYLCKVQMAFCVAFIWFWELSLGARNKKLLIASAVGVICSLLWGIYLDFLGYGSWSFGLLNNYQSNFAGGIFERVKHYPWYWYFRWCLLRGIPPISLVILLATVLGWKKFWKHPLTWLTLPLFIFHSLLGHKELRYIFPTIMLSVLYIPLWMQEKKWTIGFLFQKGWIRRTLKFTISLNILFLIISSFRPANPAPKFYRYIWDNNISEFYAFDENPFRMLGLKMNWYKKSDLNVLVIKNNKELKDIGDYYVFLKSGKQLFDWQKKKNCKLKFLSYPLWAIKNLNVGNWVARSRVWSLFHCHQKLTKF